VDHWALSCRLRHIDKSNVRQDLFPEAGPRLCAVTTRAGQNTMTGAKLHKNGERIDTELS
jgi:hypothetical protein